MHPRARLSVRPHPPTQPPHAPGLHPLGIASGRDGLVAVPAATATGVLVLFHGAGAAARDLIEPFLAPAAAARLVVVAPDSRDRSWDLMRGGDFGPDVDVLERALAGVFERHPIDPARLVIGGFSDGASYALSLGLANGDLFGAILAFSPGFAAAGPRVGTPRVFMTHGLTDRILPINSTSRRLEPILRGDGLEVRYVEFADGHRVPDELIAEAFRWLDAGASGTSA